MKIGSKVRKYIKIVLLRTRLRIFLFQCSKLFFSFLLVHRPQRDNPKRIKLVDYSSSMSGNYYYKNYQLFAKVMQKTHKKILFTEMSQMSSQADKNKENWAPQRSITKSKKLNVLNLKLFLYNTFS